MSVQHSLLDHEHKKRFTDFWSDRKKAMPWLDVQLINQSAVVKFGQDRHVFSITDSAFDIDLKLADMAEIVSMEKRA